MLQVIRRHMSYANVTATAALVFAMTGGAYAISGNGGSSGARPTAHVAKKATPKGKPGPRGPAGPKGATGASGAVGPVGPAGPAGAKGENGAAGAAGAAGASGEEVKIDAASASECPEGGTKFSNATGTGKACNGEEGLSGKNGAAGATGPQGPTGEPWTPNGYLPSGATETGTWAFGPIALDEGENPLVDEVVIASFSIPLKEPLNTQGLKEGENCEGTGPLACRFQLASNNNKNLCPGTVEEPKAAPGYFCIYVDNTENVEIVGGSSPDSDNEIGRSGVIVSITPKSLSPDPHMRGRGSWAVTAE